MKVQDFAYKITMRTIQLLEQTQHYKIPEDLQKEISGKIQSELDSLIQESK